jgi:hypothetical protein
MNMETVSKQTRVPGRFLPHGYAGIIVITLAEVLLFSGNRLVGHWFTPIVWTGYILFVDALVCKFKGRSLLVNDRLEFVIVALISIGGWWLFEWYNAPRFWKSDLELWWHYHSLEPNLFLRRAGYDWAFATISPAMFETAELLTITALARQHQRTKIKFSKSILVVLILIGAIGVVVPLVLPSEWFAPVVWLSFVLFLDPLNAWRGQPSITGDLARGDWRRLWALLMGGFICGVLWEFWNFWALSKWTYTVPFFGSVKIFEMPVLGYLGFPPFAIECWALYIFVRSLLNSGATPTANGEIFLKSS